MLYQYPDWTLGQCGQCWEGGSTTTSVDAESYDALESNSLESNSLDSRSFSPEPPRATDSCWGPLLSGDNSTCLEGFRPGISHFKNKFCDVCRDVLHLPASHMRAITPEMQFLCTGNSKAPRTGVWKQAPAALGGGEFRLLNNTKECTGPWLVIFREQPPTDLAWGPLPAKWVVSGVVPMSVAKGTLVPRSELSLTNWSRVVVERAADAADAKRRRFASCPASECPSQAAAAPLDDRTPSTSLPPPSLQLPDYALEMPVDAFMSFCAAYTTDGDGVEVDPPEALLDALGFGLRTPTAVGATSALATLLPSPSLVPLPIQTPLPPQSFALAQPRAAGEGEGSAPQQCHSTATQGSADQKQLPRPCSLCRERRVLCDRRHPSCSRCARLGIECVLPPTVKRGRPARGAVPPHAAAVAVAEVEAEAEAVVEVEAEAVAEVEVEAVAETVAEAVAVTEEAATGPMMAPSPPTSPPDLAEEAVGTPPARISRPTQHVESYLETYLLRAMIASSAAVALVCGFVALTTDGPAYAFFAKKAGLVFLVASQFKNVPTNYWPFVVTIPLISPLCMRLVFTIWTGQAELIEWFGEWLDVSRATAQMMWLVGGALQVGVPSSAASWQRPFFAIFLLM